MACASQNGQATAAADDSQKAVEAAAPAKVAASEKSAAAEKTAPKAVTEDDASEYPLYTGTPTPLQPVECGKCHNTEYTLLKNSKSKHRFICTDCHEQLHAYVPTKNNYRDVLPKCSNCHDVPHGEPFTQCLSCHQNPHTPLTIPFSAVTRKFKNKEGKSMVACQLCHWNSEGKEFATHPTKHNVKEGCVGCHAGDRHGIRPTCFKCHKPHIKGMVYKDCLVCHRPHSAKNIKVYPKDTDNRICGSCHKTEYGHLQSNKTKHSAFHCAKCHVKHGKIPKCRNCHGEPHGAGIHKNTPRCLNCHQDPHNLPVKHKS